MAVTEDWLRSCSSLPLTHLARTAIRTVCLQLAHGRVHPALGTRPLELAASDAWIGSPADGYSITWRPHWTDEQVPVLLTLAANDPAPYDGNDQLAETPDTETPARRRASFYALPPPRPADEQEKELSRCTKD